MAWEADCRLGLAKSRHSLLREGGMHLHAPKMFVAASGLLSEIAVPAAFSAEIQMITSPIAATILAARSPTAAGTQVVRFSLAAETGSLLFCNLRPGRIHTGQSSCPVRT